MAFFRCGGGLPVDLTDCTNGYGINVQQNNSIQIPITKTPRYVWVSYAHPSTNNFITAFFADIQKNEYYRMIKGGTATEVTFALISDISSLVSVSSSYVTVYNFATSARSIGAVVFY